MQVTALFPLVSSYPRIRDCSYIGDVMTSMVKIFMDTAFTVGYLVSGDYLTPPSHHGSGQVSGWSQSFTYRSIVAPLALFLPIWWRFIQVQSHPAVARWLLWCQPLLAGCSRRALPSLSLLVTARSAFVGTTRQSSGGHMSTTL